MTDIKDGAKPVAVVTGAGGDIGRAIAWKLAPNYRIAALDIDRKSISGLCDHIASDGFEARAFACDLTDAGSLKAAAEEVRAYGAVRLLVNNAGAAAALSLHALTPEALKSDLALNLEAAIACFKAFEEDLIEAGNVVNIASVNGIGTFGHSAYSAAKAGLIHATKAIAVEYGKYGLRANAIAPGTVRTQAWKARADANPNVFAEALSWYPLKHLPEPQDVADLVAFLSSTSARCITGTCIPLDCGLTAGSPALPRTFTQSDVF